VKYQRVTDLNGEVTWRDDRDDDEGGYAAGGGGMTPRPHAADGTQHVPGGVPGSTAGGEPPRWDGSEPGPRVMSAPEDEDDAGYPPARGASPRPGGYWPAGYMDGYWPRGGHGTQQAGMSSPGGANGRPPNGIGKVGPKGYVHGWIFVGVPGAGQDVHHPQFGAGKVTGRDAAHVRVRFGDGSERSFAHQAKSPIDPEAAPGPARFEPRPESDGGPSGVMTAAEARKWGNANWPGKDKLPPDQYRALLDYTRSSAWPINRYLRTGKFPDKGKMRTPAAAEKRRLDAEIATLEKACRDNPTPSEAMVVHWGTGLAEFGNVTPDKLVGKTAREPAFLSTSVGKTVSRGFRSEEVHMQLRVPKGTPAFYLDKVSTFNDERELLLNKGLTYRITSARKVRGQWQVEAEVIPPHAAKVLDGIGKGASDLSDPSPVDPEHVKSLMLANFPDKALTWVDDARWIGPVEVPQDRIDTDDEDSWAASSQPGAVKRFAKAIKHGTGHTHPVILVQSPDNPKAVVIDGHHRTLAYRKLGRPVRAYVGQVERITPEILETHSFQQHAGGDPANKAAAPGLASRSGMISLDLPGGLIDPLPGGLTGHHVTVVYLGPDVDDDAFALACDRARAAARQAPGPLAAMLTGIGTFPPSGSSDGKVPVFIPARIPGAGQLRTALEDLSASEHKDWKPHVTLAYLEEGDPLPAPPPPAAVTFTHLSVHRGDDVERFPLGAASKAAGEGNAQTLRDYWSGHGHGGPTHHAFEKEIAWGTPGDFGRCVALVTEHGKMSPDQAKGFCNLRHHEALGYWPAQHAEMERGK
jgi:2'-5' RNA ligase